MSHNNIISDNDFGIIVVSVRSSARNISMRVKEDGLYVTVPQYTLKSELMKVIDNYRSRLLEAYRKISRTIIADGFFIDKPLFSLSVVRGGGEHLVMRKNLDGKVKILCPEDTDFNSEAIQKLLNSAIEKAMKICAQNILPLMLRRLADRYNLKYRSVKISSAKSRWGSCNSNGCISLSCHLLMLPEYLVEYVILHELAHTVEMNHSPRFWNLLDSMTDGKSQKLRNEIKSFHPGKFS